MEIIDEEEERNAEEQTPEESLIRFMWRISRSYRERRRCRSFCRQAMIFRIMSMANL